MSASHSPERLHHMGLYHMQHRRTYPTAEHSPEDDDAVIIAIGINHDRHSTSVMQSAEDPVNQVLKMPG